MRIEDLPEMPSLEDVLRSLEEKDARRENDEENFSEESYPVERAVAVSQYNAGVPYPITLDCLIKREHSRNGEIQVIPGVAVICPRIKYHTNLSETPYCNLLTITFFGCVYGDQYDCPYYKAYILKK